MKIRLPQEYDDLSDRIIRGWMTSVCGTDGLLDGLDLFAAAIKDLLELVVSGVAVRAIFSRTIYVCADDCPEAKLLTVSVEGLSTGLLRKEADKLGSARVSEIAVCFVRQFFGVVYGLMGDASFSLFRDLEACLSGKQPPNTGGQEGS